MATVVKTIGLGKPLIYHFRWATLTVGNQPMWTENTVLLYDLLSDEALTTAADSETCEMWIDISKCGLTPTTTDDGKLVYNIALSTYQDPNNSLVLQVRPAGDVDHKSIL